MICKPLQLSFIACELPLSYPPSPIKKRKHSWKEKRPMTPFVTIIVFLPLLLIIALAGYTAAWLLIIYIGNRLTFKQLALQPGMHVVDVGCGSGRLTFPLAQQV